MKILTGIILAVLLTGAVYGAEVTEQSIDDNEKLAAGNSMYDILIGNAVKYVQNLGRSDNNDEKTQGGTAPAQPAPLPEQTGDMPSVPEAEVTEQSIDDKWKVLTAEINGETRYTVAAWGNVSSFTIDRFTTFEEAQQMRDDLVASEQQSLKEKNAVWTEVE